MSWSMRVEGTKAACVRELKKQKIYGTPSAEEQFAFDSAREKLLDLIRSGQEPTIEGSTVICEVAAAGHGTHVSSMTFATRFVSS